MNRASNTLDEIITSIATLNAKEVNDVMNIESVLDSHIVGAPSLLLAYSHHVFNVPNMKGRDG